MTRGQNSLQGILHHLYTQAVQACCLCDCQSVNTTPSKNMGDAFKCRWAAYYNEGNVPLNAMVPLYKLPWVFTYNSWSQQYDYMVMAAVRTAQAVGGLEPYCLFIGDKTATIYNWFIRQQVTLC